VRALLTLIVVVALLLVAADRVAWYVAERGVATAIQESEDLPQRPDVSIHGVPFLTQAFRGVYRDVDVRFRDVPAAQGVTVESLDANLTGVHVPLRDIVNRAVERTPVDRATATGRVTFPALDAATARQLPSNTLTVKYGPGTAPDHLSVTGTYATRAGTVRLRGEARLQVRNGSLVVTPVPESLNVPAVIRSTVARLLGVTYQMPELPFGFKARSVTVDETGVTVSAAAENVVLGPVETPTT
jgi:hypothetical protein